MKNTRAIIFDLDGTLFDLDPLVQAARKRVAHTLYDQGFCTTKAYASRRINALERQHGPYYSSSPYYFVFYDIAKTLRREKPDQFRRFLERRGMEKDPEADPIEAFVGELERVYNTEGVEDIKPFPDAVQTLQELRQAGYLLFLVTLGRTVRQKNKIDRLGIAQFFNRIINEGPPSHDYWFSELLEEYRLDPREVVCVGDRTHDEIRAGNRLGCTTVWLRRGRFAEETPSEGDRPDHQIRYLAQLPTLLHMARLGKDPEHLKVVVIGGGTGLPTVLRGMRTYTTRPTAVVAVTDSGASSGRIRWNLGVQPPGDIRNALTALADPNYASPGLFQVFQHRFPDSEQEAGIFKNDHIGNFLVAALTQQVGDFQKAIEVAGEMLHIQGTVLPACTENVDICAELENGEHVYTEWMVRNPEKPPLKRAYLVSNRDLLRELERENGALRRVDNPENGQVEIHARPGRTFRPPRNHLQAPREAVDAIAGADIVVLGPGSLFTSVITNLLVPDIRDALLSRTEGMTLYVCNIVTQPGQADGFTASDHLHAILRHFPGSRAIDILKHMIVQDPGVFRSASGRAWRTLLKRYREEGKELVACDSAELNGLIPWTMSDLVEKYRSDAMDRGAGDFISHDPYKVADAICRIYCGLQMPDYDG